MEKFNITKAGAYYHFRTKKHWIKDYASFDSAGNLQDQVFQRFNYVYREASFQYQHCMDHNGRIGYLRTIIEAAKCLREFLPDDVTVDKPSQIIYAWNLDKYRNEKGELDLSPYYKTKNERLCKP